MNFEFEDYKLQNCRQESGWFVFAKAGSQMLFPVKNNLLKQYKYLVYDVENKENYSVRINTGFWEDEVSGEGNICVYTGILPKMKTAVCIPLHVLDGETLFGTRYPGILKTVIKGNRVNHDKLHTLGIGLPPIHKETALSIQNVRLTQEPVTTRLGVGDLIDELGQSKYGSWPGKTQSIDECNQNMHKMLSEAQSFLLNHIDGFYGDPSKKYEARGYFRIEKEDERFWLITPDGHRFFSSGSDCIVSDIIASYDDDNNQKDFLKENLQRAFSGNWYESWADITKYRIVKWHVNTLAAWGDYAFAKRAKIPYTKCLNNFPKTKEKIYRDFPDVFSPEYRENAKEYARQLNADIDDPYMIGYFMANEPHWAFVDKLQLGYDLIRNKSELHSKKALIGFMKEKYAGQIDGLNREWHTSLQAFEDLSYLGEFPVLSAKGMGALEEFAGVMIREYVRIPAEALKAVDPNHLNLGLRYAYLPSDSIYSGSEYFDIFSINCYEHLCDEDVTKAYKKTGKPIMVGEYQFGAIDMGLSASGIRGVTNRTERGKAIRRYIERAATLPYCLGVHYFQWNDQGYLGRGDGENYNIGFVDICNKAYDDVAEQLSMANQRIYAIADGLLKPFDEEVAYVPSIFY